MPRRGRGRKKSRTHADETASSALSNEKIPKSLVIRRGKTSAELAELITDVRRMMQPFTALHFQEDPKNRKLTISQYATNLALPMGISHMLVFRQNDNRCHLRLARLPAGPVLSFRVHQFSLSRHIQNTQRRPVSWTAGLSSQPPVVVTNNFGDESSPHIKLLRITFQNLFPQINVNTVKLNDCRRVVLFNLMEEELDDGEKVQMVHVRHYAVTATPTGVNRRVRRIIIHNNNKLPNLGSCQDIADYLTNNNYASDAGSDNNSEAEEDKAVVELSESFKNNAPKQQSALKLVEMGPRLNLQLIKVEKELEGGACLYHAHVTKTPEQVKALNNKKEHELALKAQRKAVQDANVERKRKAAEIKKLAKRQRLLLHAQHVVGATTMDKMEGVSSSSESSSSESS